MTLAIIVTKRVLVRCCNIIAPLQTSDRPYIERMASRHAMAAISINWPTLARARDKTGIKRIAFKEAITLSPQSHSPLSAPVFALPDCATKTPRMRRFAGPQDGGVGTPRLVCQAILVASPSSCHGGLHEVTVHISGVKGVGEGRQL